MAASAAPPVGLALKAPVLRASVIRPLRDASICGHPRRKRPRRAVQVLEIPLHAPFALEHLVHGTIASRAHCSSFSTDM